MCDLSEDTSIFESLPEDLKSRISDPDVLNRLSEVGFSNRTNFDNLYSGALSVYDSPRRRIMGSVYDGMGHVRIIAADTTKETVMYFTQLLGGSNDYDRMSSYNNVETYNVDYFSLNELVERLALPVRI